MKQYLAGMLMGAYATTIISFLCLVMWSHSTDFLGPLVVVGAMVGTIVGAISVCSFD